MTQMSMGSNLPVPAAAVRATLSWTAGPGIPDVDCSALLLEQSGEVGSDADFVFYNQPEHYSGTVRMVAKTAAPRAADGVDVELARVPGEYQRIVLAASSDGGTFGQVPDLQLQLSDLATGQPIAAFPMRAGAETAFLSAELYRRDGQWRFRAIGQGYSAGLAGLASDFGIDVGGSAPSAPQAAAPQPAAPQAAAPTPPPAAPAASLDLGAPPAPQPAAPATASLDLGAPPVPQPTYAPPAPEPTYAPAPPPAEWAAPPPAAPPIAPLIAPPAAAPPAPEPSYVPPPMPAPEPAYGAPPAYAAPAPAPAPAPTVSLVKNERRDLATSSGRALNRVVFSLGWTPAEGHGDVDLDASVIAFDQQAEKLAIVWYMHQNEFFGSLQHTGDNRTGGAGGDAEQILVDLARLPLNVHSLIFTINSFRKQTFTDVSNAYCAVRDVETGEELVRFDLSATQPSTAVLMAELRRTEAPGQWRVRAIGEFHDYRTVKKLVPSAARQVQLGG